MRLPSRSSGPAPRGGSRLRLPMDRDRIDWGRLAMKGAKHVRFLASGGGKDYGRGDRSSSGASRIAR